MDAIYRLSLVEAFSHGGGEALLEIFKVGIFGGVLAVAAMTLTMKAFSVFRMAEGDMIRAQGSFLTKNHNMDRAYRIGMTVHLIFGVFLAFVYREIFVLFPQEALGYIPVFAAGLGFVHGGAVSVVLLTSVADFHPLERFQNPGLEEGVAHTVGHCVFGLVLGAFSLWSFVGLEMMIELLSVHIRGLVGLLSFLGVGVFATYKLHKYSEEYKSQLDQDKIDGEKVVDITTPTRIRDAS